MLHCCEMSVSFSGKRCENALKEQMLAYVGCKISQTCQLLIAFGYGFNKKRTKKTTQAAPLIALIPAVPAVPAFPVPAFPNGPLRWQ